MMYRTTTDVLDLAQELFEAKKFKDVIKALGEIDQSTISPEENAHLNLLFVESNLSRGNYELDTELKMALDYYKRSQDDEKFARAKHLHGWLLMARGNNFDAREVLLESYAMYKRHELLPQQARVSNRLGHVFFQLGDMRTCKLYLERCAKIFEELDEPEKMLAISANLALNYSLQGNISDALDGFSKIKRQVLQSTRRRKGTFYIQSSFPLAMRGEIKAAGTTIDQALQYIDDFADLRASYFLFRGWIYFLDSNYSEARNCLMEALELADKIAPNSGLMAHIKRQLGETLMKLGDPVGALAYTEDALAIAKKLLERWDIAACYRNLGELEAKKGNHVKSRDWYKKAIDLFTLIKAHYELALTQYMAATSGVVGNSEKQAWLYLAREYFEREKVTGYVNKIKAESNDVPVLPRLTSDRDGAQPVNIVTTNDDMKRLISMAEHVAASEMSVLLTGATGTGKDLFARHIHNHSGRSGRFVSINAAAIPDSMVESELFGHRRGAFTNADRDKVGLIEVAHNGTLYLNEIADASKELQAKLLDVLENHKIRRLGETKERPVAFRLVAATNHDLGQLIDNGKFRIDLYHRLGEVPLSLPSLRDRLDDIRVLLTHFLSVAGVTVDEAAPDFNRLVKSLMLRDWPGNVRQLEAEAKRLALLSDGHVSRMLVYASRGKPSERDQLFELLQQTDWNRREVARKLGVSDTTIRRKIKKFRLNNN